MTDAFSFLEGVSNVSVNFFNRHMCCEAVYFVNARGFRIEDLLDLQSHLQKRNISREKKTTLVIKYLFIDTIMYVITETNVSQHQT